MKKRTKEMLSALSSGIDITKPTVRSLHNEGPLLVISKEIRNLKAMVVNLINVLLEEDK